MGLGLPVLRKSLNSLGPLTSQLEEGRRQCAGPRDCGLEERTCVPQVPSKAVVVPGTVTKDLLKTQVRSLPERFPPQRYCQNGKKMTYRRMSHYIHEATQQLWEPWKQLESEITGCGPWTWCLMLSLSQSSSTFPLDNNSEGALRVRAGNWRGTLDICCCCAFRYSVLIPNLELQK